MRGVLTEDEARRAFFLPLGLARTISHSLVGANKIVGLRRIDCTRSAWCFRRYIFEDMVAVYERRGVIPPIKERRRAWKRKS